MNIKKNIMILNILSNKNILDSLNIELYRGKTSLFYNGAVEYIFITLIN